MQYKIYLRLLKYEDAYISYKWRNDPTIWKYTGTKPDIEITPEIELEWIKNVLKRNNEKRFAICLEDTNEYVGNVQLTNITTGSAEFHIFIGEKKYWGYGIGKEVTKKMLMYGFKKLALQKIYLYVNKRNRAAIKVYYSMGFRIEKENNNQVYMVIFKHNSQHITQIKFD